VTLAPQIKICGVTRAEDVDAALTLGVQAIGLNFWARSPRYVDATTARRLAERIGGRARIVGVFVDAPLEDMIAMRDAVGLDAVQLHGAEPDEVLRALLPHAYRAVRLAGAADVARALAAPGDEVLIDAAGALPGGTGQLADAELAARVAAGRRTWLAGGLSSANVAARIAAVMPYGLDVASGVESAPGLKDAARMEAFVRAVRG
jgi:phosphoribosylanthranilate isomerase